MVGLIMVSGILFTMLEKSIKVFDFTLARVILRIGVLVLLRLGGFRILP